MHAGERRALEPHLTFSLSDHLLFIRLLQRLANLISYKTLSLSMYLFKLFLKDEVLRGFQYLAFTAMVSQLACWC